MKEKGMRRPFFFFEERKSRESWEEIKNCLKAWESPVTFPLPVGGNPVVGSEIRGGEMKGVLCPFLLSGSFHPGAIPSCCVHGCLDVACGGGVGWGIVLAALVLWKFPRLFLFHLESSV